MTRSTRLIDLRDMRETLDSDITDRLFTNPQPHSHKHIPSSCTPSTYVQLVSTNIKAEFWCMFQQLVTPNYAGWRSKRLTEYCVLDLNPTNLMHLNPTNSMLLGLPTTPEPTPIDPNEVVKHLVIWKGHLYLTRKCRDISTNVVLCSMGMDVDKRYPDSLSPSSEDKIFSLGYVGNFLQQLRACQTLNNHDPIVQAVADPLHRQKIATNLLALNPRVPCNTGQLAALQGFHRNIEGLQGPPGTGKSTVVFHIVNSLLPEREAAIVTCVQNRAVEAIAERLSRSEDSLRFFVVGNATRLGPIAEMYLIDNQIERQPSVMTAQRPVDRLDHGCARLQQLIETLLNVKASKCWPALTDKYRQYQRYRTANRYAEVEKQEAMRVLLAAKTQERQLLLQQAKVVLCTVATIPAFKDQLDTEEETNAPVRPITMAIIDEAGTVSEQEIPVLLTMGVKRIIAIGDQKQLGPFTYADQRTFEPIGFFQRLDTALKGFERIPMLAEQYRMHPSIASVVSSGFYADGLKTPDIIRKARLNPKPIVWIDCTEEEMNDGTSKVNWGEIKYIANLVPTLEQSEVAVITFYKCQMLLLSDCVVGRDDQSVIFLTADSAQGSEYDAVVLSCVRSNSGKGIGFLNNPNRLCVALSRAKEQLLVVGNKKTTTKNSTIFHMLATKASDDPVKQRLAEKLPTSNEIEARMAEHVEKAARGEAHLYHRTRGKGDGRGKGGKGSGHLKRNGGKGGSRGGKGGMGRGHAIGRGHGKGHRFSFF